MNTHELVAWLAVQVKEAQKRRDAIDHELSPRAYGYWDGIHMAHTNTLNNLTNR